jgi:hypothetical protein
MQVLDRSMLQVMHRGIDTASDRSRRGSTVDGDDPLPAQDWLCGRWSTQVHRGISTAGCSHRPPGETAGGAVRGSKPHCVVRHRDQLWRAVVYQCDDGDGADADCQTMGASF